MRPQCMLAFQNGPVCRCFEECGELDVKIVRTIAPLSIGGYFTVICALVRMLAIAIHVIVLAMRGVQRYDIIVVDQVCR